MKVIGWYSATLEVENFTLVFFLVLVTFSLDMGYFDMFPMCSNIHKVLKLPGH